MLSAEQVVSCGCDGWLLTAITTSTHKCIAPITHCNWSFSGCAHLYGRRGFARYFFHWCPTPQLSHLLSSPPVQTFRLRLELLKWVVHNPSFVVQYKKIWCDAILVVLVPPKGFSYSPYWIIPQSDLPATNKFVIETMRCQQQIAGEYRAVQRAYSNILAIRAEFDKRSARQSFISHSHLLGSTYTGALSSPIRVFKHCPVAASQIRLSMQHTDCYSILSPTNKPYQMPS